MGIPILRTKLFAPSAGRGLVHRERLFALLDRGLDGRLTLVSAPAGFGKTTLVARWLEDRGHRAAWLSVEPSDADPVRFWSYVVAAFGEVFEDDVAATAQIVAASDPDVEAVTTSLINDLTAVARDARTLLVLDDLHALGSTDVLGTLGHFLDRIPASVCVVVTTRADPPLALSRYRARGEMAEVRQGDLRFSVTEMAEYLNGALGFDLSEPSLTTLEGRTEGWVASLQLAGLSLQRLDPADHGVFVEEFAGDDRFVMDYLLDEVLTRQSASVQRFLLATSVLGRLSQPLCEALFDSVAPGGVAPDLGELADSGLFLVPMDSRGAWFRYHHLFADLLRSRCRVEMDEAALLVRASEWYEAEGLYEESIDSAFEAGDEERAAVVLEAHFPELIGRGEFRTLRRGVDRLPVDCAHGSTGLCMAMAYVEYISTNLAAAEVWIERGDSLLATKAPTDRRLEEHRAHLSLLRAFRAEAEQRVDESRVGFAAAREAFASLGVPYLECVAEQGLAGAFLAEERLRECEETGRAAWKKGIATGNLLVSSTALNRIVIGMIAEGRLRDAEAACREHLEVIRSTRGDGELLVVGYARAGYAGVLLRQNRLDDAEAELDEVERRSRAANSHSLTARVLMQRMHLGLSRGDLHTARRASTELAGLFAGDKVLILVRRLYETLAVRLDLAEGRVAAASDWSGTVDEGGSFPTPTRIARADVMRAQGRASEAARFLERVEREAAEKGAFGWVLEAKVRRASALGSLRDPTAPEVLAEALAMAEPDGFVSPFLDDGPAMADLISVAQARGALDGLADATFVPRLLGAFEARGAGNGSGLLSARELEVLRLLDAGLSNKAVGERLFVSVGTVKRHTHNIYKKLGAARRTEALVKAREVGIL